MFEFFVLSLLVFGVVAIANGWGKKGCGCDDRTA